jgi:general secretion pathway protein D
MKPFWLLLVTVLAACTPVNDKPAAVRPTAYPEAQPAAPAAAEASPQSQSTILRGTDKPVARPSAGAQQPRPGDVVLNYPAVSVDAAAKAVLGDLLRMPYRLDPNASGTISIVTPYPIARSDVLAFFETALRSANLAVVTQAGVATITPVGQARETAGVVAPGAAGYGTETIPLRFVSAAEIRRLVDPVLPGVIQAAGEGDQNLVIIGTSGQRASVRDLVKQFDVNWLRNMSFGLFIPKRTDARLIAPELEKLLNGDGAPTKGLVRLINMERLNGILAVSTQAQYLEDVRRWVEVLDREGENNEKRLFVYRVQNGRSSDLAKTLATAFGATGGDSARAGGVGVEQLRQVLTGQNGSNRITRNRFEAADSTPNAGTDRTNDVTQAQITALDATITSDETNNALLVFATSRDYAVIEDALRQLDVLPYQVVIEAAIAEVSLTDDLRYGVQWLFQSGNVEGGFSQGTTITPTRINPGFTFFYSDRDNITTTLNALEGLTKINVLSAPKLMVLNNQTASLQIGDQVPVASASSVSTQNPDAPIVNNIEYRDTGVILKVTPRVNSGGLVLLDVAQEVSDVAETDTSGIDSPTIQTRKISSSIAVQDGQTVALGGLIRQRDTRGRSGIPLLSRIPVIGRLAFGNTNNEGARTELLVLLKPTVVRGVEDARAITEELTRKLQSLKPLIPDGQIP